MKDTYTDLRIIRTKESIREALLELITEKEFEQITVKDITTRAKINRGTFYAHYESKFDLITKLQDEFMKNLSQIVKQNINKYNDTVEVELLYILENAIFEFLKESSDFMNVVLGLNGNLTFQTMLKDYIIKRIFEEKIIEEEPLNSNNYLATYIAYAHIGVIQKWLETGRKESPQEIAQFLAKITVNGPLYAAGFQSNVKNRN